MGKHDLGKVHIYTGNGKGKTTASLGLAIRAIGQGYKVAMIQFLKQEYTGEKIISEKLDNFDFFSYGTKCKNHDQHINDLKKGEFKGFCRDCFKNYQTDKEQALKAIYHAKDITSKGDHNLVIMDEVNVALSKGLINIEDIDELIKNKSKKTELIMTGRNASKELLERADLVTEMRELKHYMYNGIPARKGIEF